MVVTQEQQAKGQAGLFSLGFSFNPFERLEASNDPYLPEYLIGHDMFAVAWETSPAALFAPPGGGKTAMRIYTLRACWLSSSKGRKFPVSYDLPLYANLSELTSLKTHQTALAAAAAADLLLACAYRPDLYLNLPPERRAFLLSLLRQALPSDLPYNLSILEETVSPAILASHLDRTYLLPDPPAAATVTAFCRTAQDDLARLSPDPVPAAPLFERFLTFILNDLAFESAFLLVDGVDGSGDQVAGPAAQFAVLAPLFEQALSWAKECLYLKAFLPPELEPFVAEQAGKFHQNASRAVITWDVPKLAEILRRRVYVASQGHFGSLDALSSPALRDVETLIAQRARPLPREAIVFAGLVLENYLSRGGEYLEPEDITQAETQYEKRSLFPDASKSF